MDVYLYDTRYAGEGGELVGSSFAGCRRHQAEEGGLQDTTEVYIIKRILESVLQYWSCFPHVSTSWNEFLEKQNDD